MNDPEKLVEKMLSCKPNGCRCKVCTDDVESMLRIVLEEVERGEVVKVQNYYSGLDAGCIVEMRQVVELKPSFKEFLQEGKV